MADDLIAFLNARLDEDEARANAMEHFTNPADEFYSCAGSRTEPDGDLEWGEEHCDCHVAQRKGRVLREVEAKRAIVSEHQPHGAYCWDEHQPACTSCGDVVTVQWPCRTIRLLAAVYSDHPSYRQEWKS